MYRRTYISKDLFYALSLWTTTVTFAISWTLFKWCQLLFTSLLLLQSYTRTCQLWCAKLASEIKLFPLFSSILFFSSSYQISCGGGLHLRKIMNAVWNWFPRLLSENRCKLSTMKSWTAQFHVSDRKLTDHNGVG